MSTTPINTGGPAFPTERATDWLEGMSLRDYFAAKALPALINAEGENFTIQQIVEDAYSYADAMIAAREVKS